MRRTYTWLLAFGLLTTGGLFAQQPPPEPQTAPTPSGAQPSVTFRVEVNYVEVDAVVVDQQGRFVRDLAKEDFQVVEDGKPQSVSTFSIVDIPIERAERPLFASSPIPPDVRTNEQEFSGRLYVIILDDFHTAPLRTNLVKKAARRFVERYMGDNDMAAVIHTSGRTDAGQEFTGSKTLVLAAIDKFLGRKVRSSTLERLDYYNNNRDRLSSADNRERIGDPADFERGYQARSMLSSLKSVSDFMAGVRGRRKAVVFFSEGIDYDIYDVFGSRDASTIMDETRDAIGAATRANVTIYGVDPRGLTGLGDESIEASSFPDDPAFGVSSQGFQDELRRAQDSLRVLSDETGGFAAVNSNDFETAFDRIVRDNSSYYLLGYYSSNERRDGRQRKLQVRVNRPGLEVRTRKSYVAARGRAPNTRAPEKSETSPQLRELMGSPLQTTGLILSTTAAPFKGVAPNASVSVAVQLDPASLHFVEKDGTYQNNLELVVQAIDSTGKLLPGQTKKADMKLRPQTYEVVRRAGFRVMSRLSLPPGRYQLRVAARESGGGRVGSVFYDLEVPDFTREGLTMSGITLSSIAASRLPTAEADEQLREALPGQPTTWREFVTQDTLSVFAEIYENTKGPAHHIDITTSLLSPEGRVAFKTEEPRSSDELQGGRGGYGHVAQIPLKDLAPGLYVLRVEARSRQGGDNQSVSKEVQLRILPTATAPGAGGGGGGGEQASRPSILSVARGARSNLDTPREVVVKNAEEWKTLWDSLGTSQQAPQVNFETTMIAGVFLGSRPSAGYQVEIVGWEKEGETLVVRYVEQTPREGTMQAQVLTSPFHLAGVPKHEGRVRFVKQ